MGKSDKYSAFFLVTPHDVILCSPSLCGSVNPIKGYKCDNLDLLYVMFQCLVANLNLTVGCNSY